MTDDDDAAEIEHAKDEADEVLKLAILQCIADGPSIRQLIGIQLALLRNAARLASVLKDDCGAQFTKASFGSLARLEYADVANYRTKKQPPKPGSHLKVVK